MRKAKNGRLTICTTFHIEKELHTFLLQDAHAQGRGIGKHLEFILTTYKESKNGKDVNANKKTKN